MIDLGPLRDYLTSLLASHGDNAPFGDDESLIKSGRLDSVDVMEIVFFLEENYRSDFTQREIKVDEFDSLATIRRLFLDAAT